jgi:hypothetical protein
MSSKLVLSSLAVFALAATCGPLRLAAQDAPSVAEAARRAREKKEAAAAKPAPLITDDTLHPKPAAPANATDSAAQAGPGTSETAAPAQAGAAESTAKNAKSDDEEEKKAKIAALKKEIAQKKESVDLLQRELTLDQSTFYRNPDYSHDTAGKAKLDSMQSDLQQQKADLADLRAKLAELGGTEETAPPAPATPQS